MRTCYPTTLTIAIWVVVWTAQTAEDPDTMTAPAGLPVRILLDGSARLPEQAFLRCRDLKTARVTTGHEALRQVRAWLEELTDAE